MWRNFSIWQICLHISPHDRFVSIFTMWKHFFNWQFVMWRISPHLSLPSGENFSTWQIFSPQAPLVVPVTNMRYVLALIFDWRVLPEVNASELHMLFSGIPHLATFIARSQIAKLAKHLDGWLFCYLARYVEHSQVGYPWKEHEKCSSEALTWGLRS